MSEDAGLGDFEAFEQDVSIPASAWHLKVATEVNLRERANLPGLLVASCEATSNLLRSMGFNAFRSSGFRAVTGSPAPVTVSLARQSGRGGGGLDGNLVIGAGGVLFASVSQCDLTRFETASRLTCCK